jgi:hypothetical protein
MEAKTYGTNRKTTQRITEVGLCDPVATQIPNAYKGTGKTRGY